MLLLPTLACSTGGIEEPQSVTASSPSGALSLSLFFSENGEPRYQLSYRDHDLVAPSALGLVFKNQSALRDNLEIQKVQRRTVDDTWEQPWGEEHFIRNHFKEVSVTLRERTDKRRTFTVVFRLFDDGFGFRYELPKWAGTTSVEIVDELTEIALTGNHQAWWTPAQAGNQYEYLYQKTSVDQAPLVHTPLTLETEDGLFLSIHEAALRDYSTMNLQPVGNHRLKAELVPLTPHTSVKAKVDLPFHSPWRTMLVEERAGDLMTNYLTLNLNEPNSLGDVSWIKPGKFVGIWWELHLEHSTWASGPKHGATTENTKKYIDFAAQNGFDGVLVEGWNIGWDSEWYNHGGAAFSFTEPHPDYDVETVVQYAKEKGVYIIGHHETGAAVTNYESQLEEAYQFLEDHGMKAVKTGYVETGERLTNGYYHQGQYFVNHAERVIKTAARHHVMVVAHETVKDTGERRTYPNIVSREVARGQEYDAWGENGGNPPNHTTILPFTRMLSGPMDFTPGAFELTLPTRPKNQVNTTLAKQLALYVVIYSPVQMVSDLPENYEKHPDAFAFIQQVPVDWETTRVLSGEIGESVAIARQERGGDDWYIGAITNEQSRDVTLVLDFLEADTRYRATIYRDADSAHYRDNPGAYTIETLPAKKGDKINLSLAAGGGAAIRVERL